MLSKALEKFIKSLKVKRQRETEGLFIAEGDKVVKELLHSPILLEEVLAVELWIKENERTHNRLGKKMIEVSELEMERISGLQSFTPVLAIGKIPEPKIDEKKIKKQWSIVLDGIQDPGNLGTILRSANWFGIDTVFCSPDCVDAYNPKVVQSSMGSLFFIDVVKTDLKTLFTSAEEFPIYAATLNGDDVRKIDFPKAGFIVIGSEGKGISDELLSFATQKISIPSFSKAESLNAAIAAGIICYELRK